MTNAHALALLEFGRVREDVAAYCRSDEGREALVASLPLDDAEAVEELKARVESLRKPMDDGAALPDGVFPPVAEAMRVLGKAGAALDVEELYALGIWSEAWASLRAFAAASPHEVLRAETEASPDLSGVAGAVFGVLERDGTVKDLPGLREIRARIRRANIDIERITAGFFKEEGFRAMLQNEVPTIRDGRTVLAVKSNYRGRVKGIVHEVSQTGQTVFIEPDELVRKNNELVEEEAKFRQELARILREVTARISSMKEDLVAARAACAAVDGLYARARHASLSRGAFARPASAGLILREARHPMLGRSAVPIALELPEDARTLIITGPNTGGKTVGLKTVGLLALMNQFGLAIPAAEGSALPVFDGVYADIGDEQSIDQSLSTFSGHMRTIGEILSGATARSLVLLDELGSGTDPEEGCAIAMSLLDEFIARGSLCVVTTHHGILKNYGYTRAGVLNASMEFDLRTLSPTYRILMGIPGESRALDIAKRNGVPVPVVEGARKYLDEERTDVAALIRGLSEKHRELDALEDERKSRLRDAMEEQRKADLKELRLRQREEELRRQGIGELKRLLSESRAGLENLVRTLREGELTPEKTKAVKEFIKDFEDKVAAEEEAFDARFEANEAASRGPVDFAEGMAVTVRSTKKKGTLVRRAKKGHWLVETESLRLTLPESDLEPAPEEKGAAPRVFVDASLGSSAKPAFELDLRGYRLAEALAATEKQVEAAALASLSLFSIIHGTGEGVLGKGIHGLLKKHPAVADYHFARPEEGGFGKTIVRLK